jgi:hypothetical protein
MAKQAVKSGELMTAAEVRVAKAERLRQLALSNPKFLATIGKGRGKGKQNKTTREVKQFLQQCFEDIGGRAAFASWARLNPTDFYRLWGKMLGVEARAVRDDKPVINITISQADAGL